MNTTPPAPPDHLPPSVAAVWAEIVEANDIVGRVDRGALEAFCTLVSRLREARAAISEDGIVVTDARGKEVAHPALAVERALAEQIRAWGDRFAPLVHARRGARGYMADATATSIAAASHLADAKYAGAIATVKTLAWLIDEAQRAGMDSLMRVAHTLLTDYQSACTALQITPASSPAVSGASSSTGAPAPERKSKLELVREGLADAAG